MSLHTKLGLLMALVILSPVHASDTSPGTMTTFGFPAELAAQYTKYVDAVRRHDYTAMSLILTPDFTRTYEGATVSHERALSDTHQMMNLMSTDSSFPHYEIKIEKFFVKSDRATLYVEEKISDESPLKNQPVSHPESSVTALTYQWTHHWVKTATGWKLSNISRHFH